jgi:heptosyltransferase-2
LKKILIIQTAYIGDVILATNLIDETKKYYPQAQIDFLCRKGNESLLINHKNINFVYVWDKKAKYKSMFMLLKQIRSQRYDLCLNIQRFFNSGLFTIFSKAKTKIGFDKNPLSIFFTKKIKHQIPHKIGTGFYHEVQRNLQLLKEINKDVIIKKESSDHPLSLYSTDKEQDKISDIIKDKSYIVLAPSSVWFTKQMDKESWIKLKKQIAKKYHLFFIGAPSDQSFLNEIIGQTDNCTNLAGKLSLMESFELMKKATRVFVNDSAPLHLASAADAKTTAIFCSTSLTFGYGPLAKNATLISKEKELDCVPCGLHGHKSCPKGHFKCSKLISTQELINTI